MTNFFDRFKPGGGDNKKKPSNGSSTSNNTNPLSNLFSGIGGTTSFSGTGQSLGGNVKPGIVIPITLSEVGPLGIKIEKSSTNTAIVSFVVDNTQAATANIQRGDILCYANTNGTEEIDYDLFLELARSNQRPLCFDIRRIVAPGSSSKAKSSNNTASGNSSKINASTELSAEAFARKQAMIAAAEKREKDHQKKYNTSKSSSNNNKPALKPILSTAEKNRLEQERQKRILDEQTLNNNSEFVQKAKHIEQQTASQLGYNPYAAQSVSAGQARTAVAATTHGTIQSTTPNNNGSSNMPSPGVVAAPTSSSLQLIQDRTTTGTTTASNQIQQQQQRPSIEFEHAFETTVTSTSDHDTVINSLTILRKLIINATTKGQQQTTDDNSKYRKIRFMTNPKIRSNVTDIPGAIDLLLSVGFQIHEDIVVVIDDDDNDNNDNDPNTTTTSTTTSESVLLYPQNTPGPSWLPTALQLMEQYTQSSK